MVMFVDDVHILEAEMNTVHMRNPGSCKFLFIRRSNRPLALAG